MAMMSRQLRVKELRPIKETTEDFDEAEKRIKEKFKKELYYPLLKMLKEPRRILENSSNALADALRSGRVVYSSGQFTGSFNASISKALKDLGATWDRKNQSWRIKSSSLPYDVAHEVSASEFRFSEKIAAIDRKLAQILPAEIAGSVKLDDLFDRTLWKTDKEIKSTLQGIIVPAQLTKERRKKIVDEWQNNMQLYIKDFAHKQIKKLRKNLQKSVFAGNRFESAVSTLQKSYDVTATKAKFLARQETSLLMTKFKESRYVDSGVKEYRWGCVHRPKDKSPSQHIPGNVRYFHGLLDGTIQRWDKPPVVDEKGNRKNPGEDYNCRCFARPIVRF